MTKSVSDREILNVFRRRYPDDETLITSELDDELSIEIRAIQDRVRELDEKNRLTIETGGKPNHWRLADTEPKDPIYDPQLGTAKRWANQASEYGKSLFVVSVGVLAAAGAVTSNHIFAKAVDLYIPLIDTGAASFATIFGVAGSVLFGLSAVCFSVSLALPQVVQWHVDNAE